MYHLDHLIAGSSLKQTNETIQTNRTNESHGREQPATKNVTRGKQLQDDFFPVQYFLRFFLGAFFVVQILVLDVRNHNTFSTKKSIQT